MNIKLLFFLFLIPFLLKSQVNLKNGLIAHYTLDGHAVDSSGNSLNGFMFGTSSVADRFGFAGKARQFNGSSNYISVPHNSLLNLSGNKSISLWYYLQPGSLLLYPALVYKQGNGDYPNFGVFFREDIAYGSGRYKVSFIQGQGTTNKENYTQQKYSDYYNQWVHIAATFSAAHGYMRIYFNGSISDSLFVGGAFSSNTSADSLQIGRGNKFGYSQSYFKGYLDDIRLYNRPLNMAEVTALYKETVYGYINKNIEICTGDSVFVGGKYRKTAGTYYDTTHITPWHDTVTISTLKLVSVFSVPQTVTICQGESRVLGGSPRTTPGVYYDTLMSSKGCDSIIISTLVVNPTHTILRNVNICQGDSVFIGGAHRKAAGLYYDSLKTTKGCDSVILSNLVVNPTYLITKSIKVCPGQKAFIAGMLRDSAGIYYEPLKTNKGCDSIVITSLDFYPAYYLTRTVSICRGQSIIINGKTVSNAGVYVDSLKTTSGCDSLIQITLSVSIVNVTVAQIGTALKALQDSAAYRWLDCSNAYSPVSGATSQVFYAASNGNYAVEVTKNGCADTSSCYAVTGVGIHKYTASDAIKVYPNPASGSITVEGELISGPEAKLKLIDYTGRLLWSNTVSVEQGNWKKTIEINTVPNGIYLLVIEGESLMHVEKIQIIGN